MIPRARRALTKQGGHLNRTGFAKRRRPYTSWGPTAQFRESLSYAHQRRSLDGSCSNPRKSDTPRQFPAGAVSSDSPSYPVGQRLRLGRCKTESKGSQSLAGGARANLGTVSIPWGDQVFCGKPRLIPPWLGSSQRLVTTLPRVKKWTPSVPCAWLSPNSELFQPPKE